jgi:hypothetical protein
LEKKSTERVILAVESNNEKALEAIHSQNIEGRTTSTNLQIKLEQIGSVIVSIHQLLHRLPSSQRNLLATNSDSELQQAMRSIFQSIWLLISGLQQLIGALL